VNAAIARALSGALGRPVEVRGLRAVGGGCINEAAVADTSEGPFFVKWNRSPPPGLFTSEAEGLRALNTGALVVPRVVCATDDLLAMEYLPPGTPIADFDEQLGRGLARLHATTAPAFGFAVDGYCGTTPQPNGWLPDWPTFWRERRLGFQLERAARTRGVDAKDRRAADRLLARLDGLLGDPEPPALIHGDLWSGNLHVTPDGRPALVDPAAYFGHREAELGMMVLFGGFSEGVFAAYEAERPLQAGWRERLPLYSLYHVLNHYNLFGGGYGRQAFAIVRRYAG
jgi:fructosamine-3-kinase